MAENKSSKVPADNIGDEHDDGLWPDFDLSTESVRTDSAVDTGYAKGDAAEKRGSASRHDTKVTDDKKTEAKKT